MAGRKYVGKYEMVSTKKAHRNMHRTAILSIILILSFAVCGTLAYIVATTNDVQNQFLPASVTCQVNANDDGTFDVTNTGDVDAYIRAAIVVNWMDSSGNVRGIAPASTDYLLTVNTEDWWQDTNTGYFYYKYSVKPTGTTHDLVTSFGIAANVTAPTGYSLSVEMVAEAIQADGDTDSGNVPAYQDAWGITSIREN